MTTHLNGCRPSPLSDCDTTKRQSLGAHFEFCLQQARRTSPRATDPSPPVCGPGDDPRSGGKAPGKPPVHPPSPPPVRPPSTPFDTAHDRLVDAAKWAKEALFSIRAFGRLPLDGLVGSAPSPGTVPTGPAVLEKNRVGRIAKTADRVAELKDQLGRQTGPHGPGDVSPQIAQAEARLATLGRLADATKYVGLGGFSIAANIQKGAEIRGFLRSGDAGDRWRAGASSAEFVNNARLGLVGITPLLKEGSSLAAFSERYAGGIFGRNVGVGANVLAGALRIGGALQDAQTECKAATTEHGRGRAWNKAEESIIGTTLDTANDAYPYLSPAEPLAWASWLSAKLTDHAATTLLAGSGYQPKSLGATHARDLMPLLSAVGLAKDVPLRDLSQPMTADQRLVATFDNRIGKAAGIGSGITDAAVTGVTVAGTAYASGGYPGAVYAGLQVEHVARQGLNLWSDHYWQRPDERRQAVAKAGLDPRLDTRKVVVEQPDFVHRLWANASANFTAGYIDQKVTFGRASREERGWLELDKRYSDPRIGDNTPRESQAWFEQMFSPERVGEGLTYLVPGGPAIARVSDSRTLGASAATVEEIWRSTISALTDGWTWIRAKAGK